MKQVHIASPRCGDYGTNLHSAAGYCRLAALYPTWGENLTALQPAAEPDEDLSR